MSTFEKIRDIFFSVGFAFTGIQESINEIAFLVDEGYLILDTITIADKDYYLAVLKSTSNQIEKDDASGGSLEHVTLKILASEYLERIKQQGSLYEHTFCGYYPDVLSMDRLRVIECGHTQNAEKMLVYFRQGDISECILIPYPDQDSTTVTGYSFTASPKLKEFLDFLDIEKRNKVKAILKAKGERV
jgi:hypothetical protein